MKEIYGDLTVNIYKKLISASNYRGITRKQVDKLVDKAVNKLGWSEKELQEEIDAYICQANVLDRNAGRYSLVILDLILANEQISEYKNGK